MEPTALPTVRIKVDTELGYMIINESDFDPEIHVLFETEKPKKTTKTVTEKADLLG